MFKSLFFVLEKKKRERHTADRASAVFGDCVVCRAVDLHGRALFRSKLKKERIQTQGPVLGADLAALPPGGRARALSIFFLLLWCLCAFFSVVDFGQRQSRAEATAFFFRAQGRCARAPLPGPQGTPANKEKMPFFDQKKKDIQ
nr:hypothetical protein [Pandoravirus massiliensis]